MAAVSLSFSAFVKVETFVLIILLSQVAPRIALSTVPPSDKHLVGRSPFAKQNFGLEVPETV